MTLTRWLVALPLAAVLWMPTAFAQDGEGDTDVEMPEVTEPSEEGIAAEEDAVTLVFGRPGKWNIILE